MVLIVIGWKGSYEAVINMVTGGNFKGPLTGTGGATVGGGAVVSGGVVGTDGKVIPGTNTVTPSGAAHTVNP